jgi:hypothetical protein
MDFFLSYTTIISKKKLFIKELTFKQLKVLNKFIQNKDEEVINICFESILLENIQNLNTDDVLTNYDKFCLLFLLRLASISPEIELKKQNILTKVNLLPAYNTFFNINLNNNYTIENNSFKIKLSLPKSLHFNNIFDILLSSIDQIDVITANELKIINFNTLTTEEKKIIFEKLPAYIINDINKTKQTIENVFTNVSLTIDAHNKLPINPFNMSLFEILKLLLTVDLKHLYDIQYALVHKLNFDAFYADNNTLTENIILINNYTEEMSKKMQETRKAMDNSAKPISS